MLGRLRTHVSTNVMGYVAILLILTGGSAAYALKGRNTVFSDDIVNGQVKTGDVKQNAITSTKVKNSNLKGEDVLADTLTGSDIDEDTLGEVPNSSALSGKSLSALENEGQDTSTSTECNPSSGTDVVCASTTFTTPAQSDILVVATGAWFGLDNVDGPDINESDAGTCDVTQTGLSDTQIQIAGDLRIGQDDNNHRSADTASSFTLTAVASTAVANPTIRLRCNETDTDMRYQDFAISVVRLNSP